MIPFEVAVYALGVWFGICPCMLCSEESAPIAMLVLKNTSVGSSTTITSPTTVSILFKTDNMEVLAGGGALSEEPAPKELMVMEYAADFTLPLCKCRFMEHPVAVAALSAFALV